MLNNDVSFESGQTSTLKLRLDPLKEGEESGKKRNL